MKLFRSSRGATLIEAMVTIGILGIVAYFVVELLKTGTMGQKTLQAQDDARVLTDNMATVLADPVACENTFGGASNNAHINPKPPPMDPTAGSRATYVFDANSNVQFQTTAGANVFGNRNLMLVSIVVGGSPTVQDGKTGIHLWTPTSTTPPTGAAFVQVTWRQMGASNATSTATGVNNSSSNMQGPANLVRYFMLNVTSMSGSTPGSTITSCSAQSANGTSFWTLAAANGAIYNNNNGGAGYVGIGTTAPVAPLHVNSINAWQAWQQADVRVGNNADYLNIGVATGGLGAGDVRFYATGTSAVGGRLILGTGTAANDVLTVSGNAVGIGTLSPATGFLLDVGGPARVQTLTYNSDRRLKCDMEPIGDPLEKLLSLHGVTYHWNETARAKGIKDTSRQIGVLAQDVERAFPEAAKTDGEGYISVNYPSLIAPVIEAIRELRDVFGARSEAQERKLALLEERARRLESENAALKAWACAREAGASFCAPADGN